MNITSETYRKRLSRTREKMRSFMENNCGLVNSNKACRCNRCVEVAIESGRINPQQLISVNRQTAEKDFVQTCKDEMEEFDKLSAVFTSNPYYLAPESVLHEIEKIISSESYKILDA